MEQAGETRRPRGVRAIERVVLLCLMAVIAVNIWTGSPLFALWVGSRVQGEGGPSMLPFAVVGALLLGMSILFVVLLGALGRRYDDLVGRKGRYARRQAPWMRSMRGERPHQQPPGYTVSGLEKILILTVVVAFACFEVWFFFFSGSPIGGPSGR